MHVVRSPVARAAPAIEAAPGTVEHAARGPGVLEQRPWFSRSSVTKRKEKSTNPPPRENYPSDYLDTPVGLSHEPLGAIATGVSPRKIKLAP